MDTAPMPRGTPYPLTSSEAFSSSGDSHAAEPCEVSRSCLPNMSAALAYRRARRHRRQADAFQPFVQILVFPIPNRLRGHEIAAQQRKRFLLAETHPHEQQIIDGPQNDADLRED